MVPLRLMGIDMADEASDTAAGGLKNFLRTIAFCSALLGMEEVLWAIWGAGGHLWVGIVLVATALYINLTVGSSM
jgi:hypothetical protein